MDRLAKGNYCVKAVKFHQGRDWLGVNANIYLDNKKIGSAYDAGDGGEMNIHLGKTEMSNLSDFIKKEHPELLEGKEKVWSSAVIPFVNLLVSNFEDRKMVNKDRNKRTYYDLKSEDEYAPQRFIKAPYSEKVVAYLKKTYGEDIEHIGNELFKIYPDKK